MTDAPATRRATRSKTHLLVVGMALAVVGAESSSARAAETTIIPAGATWKYLDDGSDQGTAWSARFFADGGWSSGPAELGYGDGDEVTVVGFGPDPNNKHITTYFRHSFFVANPGGIEGLILRIRRDDGAVVYVNGVEAYRTNMPQGAIDYTTPAASTIGGSGETAWNQAVLDPALLVSFSNTVAVEIHQASGTSSDISFDLELIGSDVPLVPEIVRGPYLQRGTPESVTVRWRTNINTDSRVRYGPGPGSLTQAVSDSTETTEHEIMLDGLSADTTYYYDVGSRTQVLAGGDADHFFLTAPTFGTRKPTRVWILGDSGTGTDPEPRPTNARAVRDAYFSFTGSRHTDLWLMLGDNAYSNGTDAEYQVAVFDMYPTMLRKSVLWPTLGNHDGRSADSATQTGVYYDIFTLPTNAEAGGLASGTEAYYAFDYGNIHFICLESNETDRSPGGAMMTWLAADLASTDQDWVIAFWHHPPYTKGSHDSDFEVQLIEMRQNALPILEAAGVDLVLTGHSHSYERSYLLDGHYGLSTTLTNDMKLDGGDGRVGGDGPYRKATLGPAANEGAVYAVAGSSGKISGGSLNHSAMYISLNVLGSMVLDIDGSRLDAVFLDDTGTVRDEFTIVKGENGLPASVPAITPLGFTLLAGGCLIAGVVFLFRRRAETV